MSISINSRIAPASLRRPGCCASVGLISTHHFVIIALFDFKIGAIDHSNFMSFSKLAGRVRRSAWRSARARGGTLEQQLALACVARERCRALELRTGLVEAAELSEEVAAHARQEVVVLEQGLGGQRIDE